MFIVIILSLLLTSCTTINVDNPSNLYPTDVLSSYSFNTINNIIDNGFSPGYYYIKENPTLGFYWPFYIYIPRAYIASENIKLMVIPNNTGERDNNFSNVILSREGVNWLPYIQLIPLFPRFEKPEMNEGLSPHYLSSGTFITRRIEQRNIDRQLVSMIDYVKNEFRINSININSKINMWGYSGSAFFISRFIILHPELVNAAAFGGHYWTMLPLEKYKNLKLYYNIGIYNLSKLTGTSFNEEAYRRIKQFIYMGTADNPIGPIFYSLDRLIPEDERDNYYNRFENLFGTTSESLFDSFSEALIDYNYITVKKYLNLNHSQTNNMAKTDVLAFFILNSEN